jgi:hypothetical protein
MTQRLPFRRIVHTSDAYSWDSPASIKLGPCTSASPTTEKKIIDTKARTRLLKLQFSGSRGEVEGIGRLSMLPFAAMRKTLPERSPDSGLGKAKLGVEASAMISFGFCFAFLWREDRHTKDILYKN